MSNDDAFFFECSPLSCNGLADEREVNRHCLFDEGESALRFAFECVDLGSEPGPYYLVRVDLLNNAA